VRAVIADDDRATTVILSRTLQVLGVDAVVAHEGSAAWELLQARQGPTLAIIDWMMPGVDGLELCRRIDGDSTLRRSTYAILLTGRDKIDDVVKGLDAGASDYIRKPFDVAELRARIRVGLRVLQLQEQLNELASTDSLTRVCSRGRWFELAATEFSRARRYSRPLSILIADLDFFKRINDTFGHHAGDDVLQRFADVLRMQSRESDVTGRLGGEEFAMLLPETPLGAAQEVARRIVEGCHSIELPRADPPLRCTCSIGVAEVIDEDQTVEATLRRADRALYRAKREGRDRWSGMDLTEVGRQRAGG